MPTLIQGRALSPLEARVPLAELMALAFDAVRALPVSLENGSTRVDDFRGGRCAGDDLGSAATRARIQVIGRGMISWPHHQTRTRMTSGIQKGGRIEVAGNVGEWLLREVRGPHPRVRQRAARSGGSAGSFPDDGRDDRIDGSAGLEVGCA